MFQLKGSFYNNEFIAFDDSANLRNDRTITRECPSDTTKTLWNLNVNYAHIEELIDSAHKGFQTWRNTSIEERIEALRRYQEVLKTKQDQIATAIALEVGKPLWEARTEAAALIAKVDVTIAASLPRIETKNMEGIAPGTNAHIYYKPVGPSFIIGPFNFPCHLANGQITANLISGNSIIFKPSEKTCYSAQLMFECLAEAKFPMGVVNLVQGDGEVARRIIKDKRIKGIFFTGSKEVGQKILETTHTDLSKLVSLELGGKNTSIIDETADLDYAIEELLTGSYLTAGQRCTSTGLVAIHDSIKDEFISRFHDLAKRIIVDHPIDHKVEPFMGPLIDQASLDQYLLFMGMAKREGLHEVMRGKQLERETPGYYVSPSIHYADKLIPKSHFLANEIFGPNVTFVGYSDFDEAINIANSTEYGLAASVFTKDHARFKHAVNNIDAGLVNLNRATVGAHSKLPFGGVKNSGNYRPAAVATVDHCVYQLATLEIDSPSASGNIKGLAD
ncbi:aldehyde dehydrogenase family protein [Halobacteriovorax sp. RZ-1]|uniref:aldehyde dehydrogenase family protein n=1 Tax=unclassified Halobacteriovorax TaxID=2639665 RepID=UPI003722EDF7